MTEQLDHCMAGGAAKRVQHCSLLASGLDVEPLAQLLAGVDWPPDPFDDRNGELNHRFEANLVHVCQMGGGRRVTSSLPRLLGQHLGNVLIDMIGPSLGYPDAAEISINRLQAGCKIPPHRDGTVNYPDRLQLALQSNEKCWFHIGNEAIQLRAGDLWRIEGVQSTTHWAVNDGISDRIVAVIDAPLMGSCSDPGMTRAEKTTAPTAPNVATVGGADGLEKDKLLALSLSAAQLAARLEPACRHLERRR